MIQRAPIRLSARPKKNRTKNSSSLREVSARRRQTPCLEGHAPASLAGTLDQMRTMDPSFDEKKFMDGAKLAFKQIVDSFAAGDMSAVAWLLGPDVRKTFDQAMAERKARVDMAQQNRSGLRRLILLRPKFRRYGVVDDRVCESPKPHDP